MSVRCSSAFSSLFSDSISALLLGILREHTHFIIAQCFVCLSFVSWFSDIDSGRQATEKTHFLHLSAECPFTFTPCKHYRCSYSFTQSTQQHAQRTIHYELTTRGNYI
jgi:hypothetical protein